MATGDIWYTKFNCSVNNRGFSFGLHHLEQTPLIPEDNGQIVALAMAGHFTAAVRGCLSGKSHFESVQCRRRWTKSSMSGEVAIDISPGTRAGEPLPGNNALFLKLLQIAGPARYNGRIYIGGQSADDTIENDWDPAYLATAVPTLVNAIKGTVTAIGPDQGTWDPVVVSEKFTPPTTAIGTPLDIVEVQPVARVMSQKRRTTNVRGWSEM